MSNNFFAMKREAKRAYYVVGARGELIFELEPPADEAQALALAEVLNKNVRDVTIALGSIKMVTERDGVVTRKSMSGGGRESLLRRDSDAEDG